MQHSTRTAKAAAVNASNVALRENRQSIFEGAEMAEIFHRGNQDPRELDDIQRLRFRLLIQNVTEAMLDIYSQTHETDFSPETWETQGVTLVRRVLGTLGGRWFWKEYADNYPTGFRREV